MTDTNEVIIEQNQRFSRSKFWQGQREFYQEKGIEAWASEVPFYITSNPFIGHHYAELLLRFFQDWVEAHPSAKQQPFYVLELGAGTGQFTFYLLKSLQSLIEKLNLAGLKIRYIMTDFAASNVQAWQQHPQLRPFVDNGLLDFAVYDLEKDATLHTTEHNLILSPQADGNPLTVIANYLFDSVVADIFMAKNKKLYESCLSLSSSPRNLSGAHVKNWQQVTIQHAEQPLDAAYYQTPLFDEILSDYQQQLKNSYFLFPIGCLQGLERLKQLAGGKLFLVSSDKGHSFLNELEGLEFPEIDFHGSFSLMVNFDAIARYFTHQGGHAFLQTPRDGLTTCVFSLGFNMLELPETSYVLQESVEGFSPSDFFNYYELVESGAKHMSLNALASTLCVSRWDPFVFELITETLCKLFPKGSDEIIEYICGNLGKIQENFFYVPGCDDVLFSIGYLLYSIDRFEEAIRYYELSRRYFEENVEVLFNLGLCYFYMKKYHKALVHFNEALELEPKNQELQRLIRRCKNHKT